MGKESKENKKIIRRHKRKEYLNYKRKSKNFNSEKYTNHQKNLIKIDKIELEKRKFPLIKLLELKSYDSIEVSKEIIFPEDFSFSRNFEKSYSTILSAVFSYNNLRGEKIILSFEECKKVEVCCLFLLDKSLQEIFEYNRKVQRSMIHLNILNEVDFKESKIEEVNKRLVFMNDKFLNKKIIKSFKLIPVFKFVEDGSKRKKSYHENKKATVKKKIREFLNDKLIHATNYELSHEGANYFEGIIGEIIDNSEQHSYFEGKWFVGVLFYEDLDTDVGEKVMETQLHFLNFGKTISESFKETKEINKNQYLYIDNLAKEILSKTSGFNHSNIFTLLSLNQSVSSLYYEKETRGTGTINFLNSFFAIGDYEDVERNLHPEMIILSGDTLIKIDTRYKPYINKNTDKYNVSLNKENRIDLPPEKSHLKRLKNFFPGTMISMRVYLNREHLKNKKSNE